MKKVLLVLGGLVLAVSITAVAVITAQSRNKLIKPSEGGTDRLRQIAVSAQGTLAPLARQPVWSGDRLRVTGLQDDRVLTEPVGAWRITLFPDPTTNAVKLGGLSFDGHLAILHLDADTLTVGGEQFPGRVISGTSPMFEEMPYRGLRFEKSEGEMTGKVAILLLQDGRVVMDFDKMHVRGVRARTYGVLTGGVR